MPMPFQSAGELFRGIPDAEAGKIARLLKERSYARDTALFHEGSPNDFLYIVKNGLVKLVTLSERGTESILHILRKDDVFGELLLVEGRRPYTAIAVTDVVVSELSRKNFLNLLSGCPPFAENYTRILTLRLIQLEREFSGLIHAWAYRRLAKELLHLAEDIGVDTRKGTRIALRLTHEDLANLIGTARETVTIQLNKFEEMGLLRREGRNLVVDRFRLREYVQIKEY